MNIVSEIKGIDDKLSVVEEELYCSKVDALLLLSDALSQQMTTHEVEIVEILEENYSSSTTSIRNVVSIFEELIMDIEEVINNCTDVLGIAYSIEKINKPDHIIISIEIEEYTNGRYT